MYGPFTLIYRYPVLNNKTVYQRFIVKDNACKKSTHKNVLRFCVALLVICVCLYGLQVQSVLCIFRMFFLFLTDRIAKTGSKWTSMILGVRDVSLQYHYHLCHVLSGSIHASNSSQWLECFTRSRERWKN